MTSSSSDDPDGKLSAELTLPIKIAVASNGAVTIDVPSPFGVAAYSSGSGDMTANNPWHALVWLSIPQASLELDQKADSFVQYSVAGSFTGVASTNATFSATYSLPTTYTVNELGQQIRTAKEYLS